MGKHLTVEQRYEISVLYGKGYSQKAIAKDLQKDKSVISRELKRNCDKRSGEYKADLAQCKHEKRQKEKPKHRRFTKEVEQYVTIQLQEDLSPEQIAGRAKLDGITCVSHERIYQFVYSDKRKKGTLHCHLRRKGRRYRKRGNNKDQRGIIKNRKSIIERPKIVDEQTRLGDLEIDTIIGKNHQGAIVTINERRSGYLWMSKLDGKNAEQLKDKTIALLHPNRDWIHTITGDNGKEFAEHEKISTGLNIDFYFADPYSSWQRGANENTNGLIRQYIPKKSSFESIKNQDITHIQNKLNNRPRKKLNFLTPKEFLVLHLHKIKVAFVT